MNNLDAILEVAIGLVFAWLILSATTMEAQNIIGRFFQVRAKFLEKAILDMFHGESKYVEKFYEKPAIQALFRKGIFGRTKLPDYIPTKIFGDVALEVLAEFALEMNGKNQNRDSVSAQEIIDMVKKINDENPQLGYALNRMLPNFVGTEIISKTQNIGSAAREMKRGAENFFNEAMEKASTWYKEQAQVIAFVLGLVLATTFNIDTIAITQQLWREPTVRQSLVAQAQVADENTGPDTVKELEIYYQDLALPVGWEKATNPTDVTGWLTKLIGLFLSAFAAMQGAPFWFDILRNLLDVKGTKKDPEDSPPSAQTPSIPEAVG